MQKKITLPSVEVLALNQCKSLRDQLGIYMKMLDKKEGQDYLEAWFDSAIPEAPQALRNWFIENADPFQFELFCGSYFGKRSTYIRVARTRWLIEQYNFEYKSTEDDGWWEHVDRSPLHADPDIKQILNPPNLKEIIDMFTNTNDLVDIEEDILSKLYDYIHVEMFHVFIEDVDLDNEDGIFVHPDAKLWDHY